MAPEEADMHDRNKGGGVKKTLLVLVVSVLLLPVAAQAKFTLGGPDAPVLNIGGQVKFGPDIFPGAAEGKPLISFRNTTASLFFTGNLVDPVSWFVHPSMAGGTFTLLECYANWQPAEVLAVVAGQQKAPFGRVYNCSAAKLLFMTRNPLTAFAPKYQLGVTPVVTLPGGWLVLKAGVFNGEGLNKANADPGLMYTASLEIAPLAAVPGEESANKGYDDVAFLLAPGFWTNAAQQVVKDTMGRVVRRYDETTTAYGAHAALRWTYLALDAAYYMKTVETPDEDGSVTTDGLSAQAGYAFAGKYEPIARFTMMNFDDPTTTIEAGFNWYFNSYASRLGLNFEHAIPPEGDAMETARLYYEFQF
jgi:hypothetical protein